MHERISSKKKRTISFRIDFKGRSAQPILIQLLGIAPFETPKLAVSDFLAQLDEEIIPPLLSK